MLVVIESPYAGDIVRNIFYARRAMKHCLDRGEFPIASHLLYTQEGILDDTISEQRQLGINAGLAWSQKADLIIFYLDYGVSRGMIEAMLQATKLNKLVDFRIIGINPYHEY